MTYFRQISSAASDRFSYLLADMDRRQAVIIDPAEDQGGLYLSLLAEIQVRLVRILLTHSHGEPMPGVDRIAAQTKAPVSGGEGLVSSLVDQSLADGALVDFGDEVLHTRLTPGHTAGCTSYLWRDRVFTGDTLLIDDCGSLDTADSDPGALFDSLTRRLLTLPDETLVYPGRNGAGRRVSCIGEQRSGNRFLTGVTRDEFIAIQSQRRAHPFQDPPTFKRSFHHD